MRGPIFPFATFVAGVALALPLSVLAADVVGPLFVWGGTECAEGVCWSYFPSGFLLSVLVSVITINMAVECAESRRSDTHPNQ